MEEDKNVVYSQGTSVYKMPQKLGAPDVIHQQVLGKTQDKLKKDKKGKAYITLDTFANAGEVIEVGKGRFQYKITMQGGFENGNPTYYIKRTDGEDITNADYLNIQAGDDVHFMSRFTGYELMDIWYDAHGVDTSERCIREEPICNVNDFGCCPRKPVITKPEEICGFIFTTGAFILNTNNDRFKTTDSDC